MKQKELTQLLKNEMKPAFGVTEVGAIALAAARAYSLVGGEPKKICLTVNGGMYKNAFSCAIPGTDALGNEMAAALGVLVGNWELGLEVLKYIKEEDVATARSLVEKDLVSVKIEDKSEIYILAQVQTEKGQGTALIRQYHSNFVLLKRNEEVLYQQERTETSEETLDFDGLHFSDLFDYAKNVELSEISFLKDMIVMNKELAKAGAAGVGLQIKDTLEFFQKKGMIGEDMIYAAQRLTCNAMDARLAGLPLPAMSIAGSGSHGILCSLPVISYGEVNKIAEEEVLRALALSCLVTLYSKHYSGRLSPLCGCVMGGGSGAAAALVSLMGGTVKEVGDAINLMAANLTGMICDGGSIGCSLKASSGVYASYLSAMLAMRGIGIPENFGIIGSVPEQTVYNIGRVSAEGMEHMDGTTIAIMKQKR